MSRTSEDLLTQNSLFCVTNSECLDLQIMKIFKRIIGTRNNKFWPNLHTNENTGKWAGH